MPERAMLSGGAALFARERPRLFGVCPLLAHCSINSSLLPCTGFGQKLTDPPTSLIAAAPKAYRRNLDLTEREAEGGRLGIYSEPQGPKSVWAMNGFTFGAVLLQLRKSGFLPA